MNDDIRSLWAQDAAGATGLTPEALDRRARALRRRLIRRDAIEYAAGALAMGVFALYAVIFPDWGVRAGCVAVILSMLVVLRNLWVRRMPAPPEALGEASSDFYRAQLVRQREVLLSVPRWYIAPVVPGLALLLLAIGWKAARIMPFPIVVGGMLLLVLPVAGIFWGIARLNRVGARRFDAQIAELDRMRGAE